MEGQYAMKSIVDLERKAKRMTGKMKELPEIKELLPLVREFEEQVEETKR